jgi:hypothetical protein
MLRKSSSPFTGRRVRSSGFGVDLAAAPDMQERRARWARSSGMRNTVRGFGIRSSGFEIRLPLLRTSLHFFPQRSSAPFACAPAASTLLVLALEATPNPKLQTSNSEGLFQHRHTRAGLVRVERRLSCPPSPRSLRSSVLSPDHRTTGEIRTEGRKDHKDSIAVGQRAEN